MLDIHPIWFLSQMGGFLLFMYLLHLILFKPFLTMLAERDDRVKTALGAAKTVDAEREKILSGIREDLSTARAKAREVVLEGKRVGAEEQKRLMDAAQAEAVAQAGKAAAELAAAAEQARQTLKGQVEGISGDIAGRLVGGLS